VGITVATNAVCDRNMSTSLMTIRTYGLREGWLICLLWVLPSVVEVTKNVLW
jgi:hypothetical protein